MSGLRLIADDLTGALDSAVHFVPAFGPLPVRLTAEGALPAAVALDAASREKSAAEAAAIMARLAPALHAPGALAFLKLDSLLRGHAGGDIAALAPGFAHVVIAPALPVQARVTRGGRQMWLKPAGAEPVGEALGDTLPARGLPVTRTHPGAPLPPGLSLWDAETDTDLDALVAAGRAAQGPVLWAGAAGLAAALARALPAVPRALPPLEGPVLGLIGTDHPVMAGQLAAAARHRCLLTGHDDAAAVRAAMARTGLALATLALPAETPRAAAQAAIAAAFANLTAALPAPGTLFVSGGETARALMAPLGASGLTVLGEAFPGVPRARFEGGRWAGVTVLTKSGAFGPPDLFHRLFSPLLTDLHS